MASRAGVTEGHAGISPRAIRLLRFGSVAGAGAVFGVLYWLSEAFRGEVREGAGILASGDVGALGEYILSYGAWAPVASTFLMVLQSLAAPLPSFVVTFANGLAFGTFWGWALSLFGHTLAAAVCFWIARALGRVPVEVIVGRSGLESADRWFARWGLYAVVVARLVPGISFDVISYAAGITQMRFRRFLGATALGVFPQTFVYSYLGHRAPEHVRLFLLSSAVIIAGVLVAALIRRRRRGRIAP
ncbi:TVP38/TMEM64 family protein [Rubrobacter marinus]|uniref:TVP38/TMEM64 family membrane protein n=1 Tax=Rubrobacter marinus TaxID=2653852 RepID=A0A6G8PU25_9ACTN|nr:TVP38/TMEM64 family protein [Rubrobacter marinus]QIN77930.1 TVP38/TMEM64 family protein [Rubrobacter marinus]